MAWAQRMTSAGGVLELPPLMESTSCMALLAGPLRLDDADSRAPKRSSKASPALMKAQFNGNLSMGGQFGRLQPCDGHLNTCPCCCRQMAARSFSQTLPWPHGSVRALCLELMSS